MGDGIFDPGLDKELKNWKNQRARTEGDRLFVSERAHVILPYHRFLMGWIKKGTTGRESVNYADKINRIGLRFGDIESEE